MGNQQEKYLRIYHTMEQEGLGYYILHYTDSSSMPNDDAKNLFEKTYKALKKFMKVVEEEHPDIHQRVKQEGVSYYLMHYTDSSSMPDKKSKALFERAYEALRSFKTHIENNKGD